MNFPQLSNINSTILKTINNRIGNNISMSQLKPWIRVMSATGEGFVLESLPESPSFTNRYGTATRGGMVGMNWKGEPIQESGSGRGLRPSPIIDALSVSNGTEGLSRKISFNVKCFTLGQAEIIIGYLNEPGYTVLVEYGWNTPISVQQKCPFNVCAMVAYNNLGVVKSKRTSSEGTYDAFLGYITGGGMKYGDAESFDISVELTTIGEIPAYLQQHKGFPEAKEGGSGKETSKKYKTWEINKAVKDEEIGQALFMQMFNDLPGAKQTDEVKKLIDKSEIIKVGNVTIDRGPFASTGNFINMDKDIREQLTEDLTDANMRLDQTDENKGKVAKIPEGVPLISQERFIRMGLAMEILNATQVELKPKKTCDGNIKTMNFKIAHEYTICRAFKHIFSADPTKLFIPNKNMPGFGLVDALTATEDLNSFIDLKNLAGNVVDIHPETTDTKRYFPNEKPLGETNLPSTQTYTWDSDYIPYVCDAFEYGLLADLFINYDFFLQCIQKNGLVIKDVLIDMLNGLSSAVNFYWDFQIRESGEDGGNVGLTIVDNSFCGKKAPTAKITKWQSRGLDSPFIDCGLDFDIPGAMKNQIVAQRCAPSNSTTTSFVSDGKEIPLDTLFAKDNDPVLEKLNSMRSEAAENQDAGDDTEEPTEEDKEQEIRKANYELFTQKAGVYPKVQDRNGNTDAEKNWYDFLSDSNANTLEGLLFVGAWRDFGLLKTVQLIDELGNGAIPPAGTEGQTKNSVLLPIKFNFTIPGVSGLKIGDIFKIIDLPKKYRDRVFQVTQVEHSIDDSGWSTTVNAQIRNQT